jgi:TRAP transporter TAXI family solute receptor
MTRSIWRWIAVVTFAVAVVLALRLIGPGVPNEIRLLTGPEGTTFHDDGLLYQEILSRHGVTIHLVQTSGSVENIKSLTLAEDPTAAFIWGLWDSEGRRQEPPEGVESLGTLYRQPLWVFARKSADVAQLRDLSGFRVEAGKKGSDSRLLALFLLEEAGIGDDVEVSHTTAMTAEQVREAAENDRVGAIIAVGEPDSKLIDTLLRSPALQVLSIERAEAFAIQYPFLQVVRLPEAGHDLRANIPDQDLQLLAATAQLVVSDPFPPALADLLLQAAKEVHGGETPFSVRGEFPNPKTAPLPLNRAADKYFTEGPSKLQKYLPFRLATWVDRFLAAFVAIASAAVTIFNIVPAIISLPFRRSIKRGYRDLQALERLVAAGTDKKTLLEAWDRIERTTATIEPPIRSLGTQWLELRQYMHDMHDRLEAM